MYRLTVDFNDHTKIGPRQIDTTLEAAKLKEELESDPLNKQKFLTAFVELPSIETRGPTGRILSGSEMINLATYEDLIAFLGRSNG